MELGKQDLKFIDFSGGITDFDVPGAPTRMRVIDNMYVTPDRHAELRQGSEIHGATTYILGTTNPVRTLVNFREDGELLAHSLTSLYYLNPTWTSLLGPTGNQPFANNVAATQIDTAQWKSHAFLTSGVKTEPAKIYRDSANTMRLRTAGLPKTATADTYSAATLLAAAIVLAIEIKTKMLLHVNDFGAFPALHIAQDAAVNAALSALVNPVTLADLITYTGVLKTQYTAHIGDARSPYAGQIFHAQLSNTNQPFFGEIKDPILNFVVDPNLPSPPTTLAETILVLNDIRNKYNWHTNAPITHRGADSTSAVKWGLYQVVAEPIIPADKTPKITPNYDTFIRYVNNLRGAYNYHLGTTDNRHRFLDTTLQIIAPAATTLHGAVAILALLEFYYAQHFRDANYDGVANLQYTNGDYYLFTGTTTIGSPDITAVSPAPDTTPIVVTGHYQARVGTATTNPYGWSGTNTPFPLNSRIVATLSGPNLIQMNANAGLAGTFKFAFSGGRAHYDTDRNADALTSSALASRNFLSTVDLTLANLNSLTLAAAAFATRFKGHEIGSFVELDNADLAKLNQAVNPDFTYYELPSTFTGTTYIPHLGVNGAIFFPSLILFNVPKRGQGYFEAGLAVSTFLYKFVYRYDYTVGQETFIDFGTPSDAISITSFTSPVSMTAGATAARDPVQISSIPVLANTATQNWDTANILIEVYRTNSGGTVYRKVGQVTNGTTTFTDSILDANNTGVVLYTTGGVVGNDQPPKAKYIEILNGTALYGNYDEGGETFPNRVRQSILNDPDSVPASFFDEFDEDVMGIGSTRSNFVVFCTDSTHRMEGSFDSQGRGFLRHEKISDTVGCINHASIVKTDVGLFYAGNNGFYYTDGYQVLCLSNELRDTYRTYTTGATQKSTIVGTFDSLKRRVLWTMKSTEAAAAPDRLFVFDLSWGIKQDGVFTTWSGTSLSPTALTFFQGNIYRGHQSGYILRHKDTLFSDPKVNTLVAATLWTIETIMWSLESTNSDFGSAFMRKYATQLFVEAKQITNVSIQPTTNVDKGRKVNDLKPIRSRKLLDWGDPNMQWTTEFTAEAGSIIDQRRRLVAGSLRGNYLSVKLGNAFTTVIGSDTIGLANITKTAAQTYRATLTSLTYNWPTYAVDYYIKLAGILYLATIRVSNKVIEFTDPTDSLAAPQLGVKWELWGYPKNECPNIVGFHVSFLPLGQQQHAYQGAITDGGQNA